MQGGEGAGARRKAFGRYTNCAIVDHLAKNMALEYSSAPKTAYCQSVGINAVDFPVPLEARVDARESSVKRERHTKTAVPATSAETVYMRRRHEGGRGGGRRLHSILGR